MLPDETRRYRLFASGLQLTELLQHIRLVHDFGVSVQQIGVIDGIPMFGCMP